MTENQIEEIVSRLGKEYPDAETELNHSSPFELLVATILSAQTTDKQVNKVTAKLFKKYNQPEDFARLEQEDLEKEINSIGLYKNKSKYLIETSKMILENYNGKVPDSRNELIKLAGVGRKTANVIISCAFEKNAIAVDTHVFRLANRLGFVNSDNLTEVENALMEKIPEEKWSDMHHYLIYHGRRVCKARNPLCDKCILTDICPYYEKNK
ncbi:MAG: endonuclease III [Halanaerobiales bacterium]